MTWKYDMCQVISCAYDFWIVPNDLSTHSTDLRLAQSPAWRVDARHLRQEALRPLTEAAHGVLAPGYATIGCHKPTFGYRFPKILRTRHHLVSMVVSSLKSRKFVGFVSSSVGSITRLPRFQLFGILGIAAWRRFVMCLEIVLKKYGDIPSDKLTKNWKIMILIGKSTINGLWSIAMWVYQMVITTNNEYKTSNENWNIMENYGGYAATIEFL